MKKNTRIFRSAEERAHLLAAWRNSGLPADEFAESRSIKPKTFYWWRWQASHGAKKNPGKKPAKTKNHTSTHSAGPNKDTSTRVPRLVKVEVEESTKVNGDVAWELEAALGLTLRVRAGIEKDELEPILHAMLARGTAT